MQIKESLIINYSITDIWKVLEKPGNMPAWNYKCCSCECNHDVNVGSKFEATFILGKRKNKAQCEIIELQDFNKITIRYSGDGFSSKGGFVDETFLLSAINEKQTKLKLLVDFTNSKLPIIVKCLMWLINRFGNKAGQSSLHGINDLLK